MIRRFIPMGKRIDSYTAEEISNIEIWCNSLPRKILGYLWNRLNKIEEFLADGGISIVDI